MTRVIGPALAGVMLQTLGPAWCLWVGLVSSLGIVATILMMRLPAWSPPPPSGSVLGAIKEALIAVWHTPPVRRLLAMTGVLGVVALPFQTFLPALARDSLNAGPEVLGLLTASVGIGAILGALGSGAPIAKARPALTLIALATGVAAGLALLALSATLWLALAALALLGLSTIGFLSIANVTIQLGVPEALVGRVMGLWVVLNAGAQPFGALIEGAVAERWGLSATFGARRRSSARPSPSGWSVSNCSAGAVSSRRPSGMVMTGEGRGIRGRAGYGRSIVLAPTGRRSFASCLNPSSLAARPLIERIGLPLRHRPSPGQGHGDTL